MVNKNEQRKLMKGFAIAQCILDHHITYMWCNYPVYNSKLDNIKHTSHKLFSSSRPIIDKRRYRRSMRNAVIVSCNTGVAKSPITITIQQKEI